MVKRLVILLFLLFPALSSADYYMGISKTYNVLHFDVEREVDNAIDDNGYRLHVEGLAVIGYPLVLETDLEDHNIKFTLGKELGDTWAIEYTYENLGKYAASAEIHYTRGFSLEGYDAELDTYAEALASLEAEAHSLSFVGKMPLVWGFYLYDRIGAAYMKGAIKTEVDYGINVYYDDIKINTSKKRETKQTVRGIAPYLGIGLGWDVTKNIAIRAEHSRYGLNDVYFASSGIELIYKW